MDISPQRRILSCRISFRDPNGTATSYTYDVASRLASINHLGPSGIIENLAYQYDPAGNRTSLTRSNAAASLLPAAVASASYDAANEQTAFAGATLTYDANGNLTNDGVNSYQWDARNRLTGISGGTTASFRYDALGRRISKTLSTQSSALSTAYLYDGNDIAAEIGGGAIGANYLRSLNIDEPFIRQTGTGTEFYHADALGSSLALSNSQGASGTTYGYEPFGKTTVTGTSANALQFTGRENDGAGLYYYRARYYSSGTSRFISEDPVDLVDQVEVNLYEYVNGDPVSLVDPLGLWSISISAFAGPGFSFTSGQNPNGSGFVSLQLGYGLGGGVKYDPAGQQPGYDPSRGTSWGLGLGGYAQGDFNAGYIYAGAVTNAGVNITKCGTDPYANGPRLRAGLRGAISGINATAHAGGQITIFGGGKLKQ